MYFAASMLALQARLSTAFVASISASVAVTSNACAGRGRVSTLGRMRNKLGSGCLLSSTSARSCKYSGRDNTEKESIQERGSGVSAEERAARRAERRRERDAARKARALQVGRAKSVRRPGSPTYSAGLEALLPAQGPPGSGAPALSGLPDLSKPFTVLGIETSCDDTAAAVVRSDGEILGEAISGQADVHEQWGGVVPGLARDWHEAKMDDVVERALRDAGMDSITDVDAVAVTVGPGLEICLRVGCEKAKTLARTSAKPFVAVHHLEAHALLARKSLEDRAENPSEDAQEPPLEFPFLGLLVSGGHCQLLLCEGVGLYTVLGGTIDDALGEAYDKAARLLGLKVGGGGGPAVEALALQGDPTSFPLSVPMQVEYLRLSRKDCDFSFAGLKNSFRMAVTKAVQAWESDSVEGETRGDEQGESAAANAEARGAALPESTRADLAASFQHTAVRHLEDRVRRAMDLCEAKSRSQPSLQRESAQEPRESEALSGGITALAVVGGVAANKEVRRRLQALCDERDPAWRMVVPPARLCTDNGVMVAWAAVERLRKGMSNTPEGQEVYARLPLGRAEDSAAGNDVAYNAASVEQTVPIPPGSSVSVPL